MARRSRFFRIIQALDRSPVVSYMLDSDYRFVDCNPAWDNFSEMNGAPRLTGESVLGLSIFDVIPDVLKNFYSDAFFDTADIVREAMLHQLTSST